MKKIEHKFRIWKGNRFISDGIGFTLEALLRGSMPLCECGYVGDLVFQQWTGLYDKNGKEVYEGDILTEEARENYGELIFWKIFMGTGTIDFNEGEYASLNSGFLAQKIYTHQKEYDGRYMKDASLKYLPVGVGSEFEFENWGSNGELETKWAEVISNCFEFVNCKNIPETIKIKASKRL